MDVIWTEAARRVGFAIERTPDCFASVTPEGVILLGTADTLDADDCLAQMIFHELCHSLVQGEANLSVRDWGLDNETARDVSREHATLRVQAALGARHGLRRVLAPTTDFRAYYDQLPDDPLDREYDRGSFELAQAGLHRSEKAPWAPHLAEALAATAAVVDATLSYARADDLFRA